MVSCSVVTNKVQRFCFPKP